MLIAVRVRVTTVRVTMLVLHEQGVKDVVHAFWAQVAGDGHCGISLHSNEQQSLPSPLPSRIPPLTLQRVPGSRCAPSPICLTHKISTEMLKCVAPLPGLPLRPPERDLEVLGFERRAF